MIHKEKIRYVGRDERMDSIGIPINPHAHAKQSTIVSEFDIRMFWEQIPTDIGKKRY